MRRIAAGLVWVCITAGSGLARGDDGPPPLAPPVVGPVAEPPAPAVPPTPAQPRPRQMLAIPGLTAPRSTSRSFKPVQPASPAPSPPTDLSALPEPIAPGAGDSLPPLIGPGETGPQGFGSTPAIVPGRPSPANPPRRGPDVRTSGRPPITLESVPAGEDDPVPPATVPRLGPSRPRTSPLPPRRAPGLFGRPFPPSSPGSVNRRAAGDEDSLRIEPHTDPAADAALRRRIDRQVRDGLGPKLRMYEVRVVGRDVVIRARPARFWQRRAVRKELEALPALGGLKARVEILD